MPARDHASGAQFRPEPDALKPGFHGVRAHWNRGFMAFRLARRTRTVMPVVPT
jgi:hypothetical protein